MKFSRCVTIFEENTLRKKFFFNSFVRFVIQTPLSLSNELEGSDAQETTSMLSYSPASGMAWLYVNRDGSITYNVQLNEIQESPVFTLMPSGKGRKILDIQQFTPSNLNNGFATGTLDKLR